MDSPATTISSPGLSRDSSEDPEVLLEQVQQYRETTSAKPVVLTLTEFDIDAVGLLGLRPDTKIHETPGLGATIQAPLNPILGTWDIHQFIEYLPEQYSDLRARIPNHPGEQATRRISEVIYAMPLPAVLDMRRNLILRLATENVARARAIRFSLPEQRPTWDQFETAID